MAHVAVGVAWLRDLCSSSLPSNESEATPGPGDVFLASVARHARGLRDDKASATVVKGPFNHEARAMAGMERSWYEGAAEEVARAAAEMRAAEGGG